MSFGHTTWSVTSRSLIGPRIAYDIEATSADGFVRGNVEYSMDGAVTASNLAFDIQLSSIPELMTRLQVPVQGLRGRLLGRLDKVLIEQGWPITIAGTIDLENLVVTYIDEITLGSYQIAFPGGDIVIGSIEESDAPFDLQGATLVLNPDRSYELDGLIATTARTPQAVRNGLRFVGPQDVSGNTRFNRSGSL